MIADTVSAKQLKTLVRQYHDVSRYNGFCILLLDIMAPLNREDMIAQANLIRVQRILSDFNWNIDQLLCSIITSQPSVLEAEVLECIRQHVTESEITLLRCIEKRDRLAIYINQQEVK